MAALGVSHETNTFASAATDYVSFELGGITRGDAIVQHYGGSRATMAGFFAAAERLGVEVVPLVFASANPSGTITADAFERITKEMLHHLHTRGPWDGVLLALHGAGVSEAHPDVEGEVTARVRALLGQDVPIGQALDMHANLSRRMIDNTTITTVYRTNPHLDARERAFECAELLVRTIRGDIKPVQALETPPVVINIVKQFTAAEPMRSIVADIDEVLTWPGLLSASVAEGYPYADVEDMGMAFLATHDGEPAAARKAARWMAQRAWQRRADFCFSSDDLPGPADALRIAVEAPSGPVVLMDVGDNIGGGSPGDSTVLLAEARRLGVRSYLQTLYDPDAVSACVAAGVGATVSLRVGARTDGRHGTPVEVSGRVRVLADGQFEDTGPTHGGARYFNQGTTAVVETEDDHTLVLTSRLIGNTSLQQLYSVGVNPTAKHVVVAKGVQSPRPAYEPIASRILLVDTPGVTAADLSAFDYQRRRRPLFPFEADATYD